jgi:CxxC-x17-CxxC domain-containing protein
VSRYTDKVLACRDCGNEFAFSSGEQEFYSTRGFGELSRCADCRKARKAARAGGDFATTSSAPRSSYGSRDSVPSRSTSGIRQMFKVTCAECGQETEVPFEPRSGRPVYCRDCFEQRSARR